MQLNKIIIPIISLLIISTAFAADSSFVNPDPHRYQSEIDAFQSWDQKNSYPENAILFAGSSSIRMWKTHNAFPQFPVINRGFGGAHISDVLFYYKDVIQKYKPAIIVFYCGDNDIAGNKPVNQVFGDYLDLVSKIKKDFPKVKLIFISVKPSSNRWNYWDKMNELNTKIKNYNQKNDHLFYIDLATPLLDKEGKPDSNLFLEDQLHLNQRGYKVWNSILNKILKTFSTK